MKEKSLNRKKRILIVLIVVCAAVFAVCAYMLCSYYFEGARSESAFDDLRLNEETAKGESPWGSYRYSERLNHYKDLYDKNNDFVAWLRVYGTDISYPVMQTPSERDYYLHRDFNKKYSAAGTLFASDISDVNKPSNLTIIYGHMMKNKTMFGELSEYAKQKYMEGEASRRYIRLDTLKEERFYRIFSVFTTAVNTGKPDEFKYYNVSDFDSEADFDAFLSEAKRRELYDTGLTSDYGDELLALSTCEYTQADGRLVLLAKRINFDELGASAGGAGTQDAGSYGDAISRGAEDSGDD